MDLVRAAVVDEEKGVVKTNVRNRTADHDIDEAQNTQITIYAGRGLCK